jgi:hypothetical protein
VGGGSITEFSAAMLLLLLLRIVSLLLCRWLASLPLVCRRRRRVGSRLRGHLAL